MTGERCPGRARRCPVWNLARSRGEQERGRESWDDQPEGRRRAVAVVLQSWGRREVSEVATERAAPTPAPEARPAAALTAAGPEGH